MQLIFIVVAVVVAIILFVLFSNPGEKATSSGQRTQSALYSSIIRNSYPKTRDVYKTLEDAGIPACFLEVDDDE